LIEDIVESTPAPPFLINCGVNMTGFENPSKVVARKRAFSTLPNA
jgi:hypothetical protein